MHNVHNLRNAIGFPAALIFVALLLVSSFAAAATGNPVAMVSDLQGKAALVSGAAKTPLALLADLEAGAQIELDAGARMVLLYLDGSGEYVLAGPALVAVRAQQAQTLKGSPAQKRSVLGGKAHDLKLKPLGTVQGAMVMRSAGPRARIRLLTPAGTRTLEASPEFRWQHDQPGQRYRFELIDDTGKSLYETDVAGTSVKLPATVRLAENVPYSWSVSARLADGAKSSSSADFSIAPSSMRQQIATVRPAASASLSERVAYAAWLEQLELRDEARPIWRALAAERPGDERLQTLARD